MGRKRKKFIEKTNQAHITIKNYQIKFIEDLQLNLSGITQEILDQLIAQAIMEDQWEMPDGIPQEYADQLISQITTTKKQEK